MASYSVNKVALVHARELIEARRYVLRSDWGERQPRAADQNRFLKNSRSTPTRTTAMNRT